MLRGKRKGHCVRECLASYISLLIKRALESIVKREIAFSGCLCKTFLDFCAAGGVLPRGFQLDIKSLAMPPSPTIDWLESILFLFFGGLRSFPFSSFLMAHSEEGRQKIPSWSALWPRSVSMQKMRKEPEGNKKEASCRFLLPQITRCFFSSIFSFINEWREGKLSQQLIIAGS